MFTLRIHFLYVKNMTTKINKLLSLHAKHTYRFFIDIFTLNIKGFGGEISGQLNIVSDNQVVKQNAVRHRPKFKAHSRLLTNNSR